MTEGGCSVEGEEIDQAFDYVIVGAGSAGCVLANRLSADPAVSVAVLGAGWGGSDAWGHVPGGYVKALDGAGVGGG